MQIIAALLCALAIFGVLLMIYRYVADVRRAPADWPRSPFRFPSIHRLTRRDALLAFVITLAYAAVAFLNLGSATAPQTFYRFTERDPALIIDLGETRDLGGITYYTGSFHDRSADKHPGYYLELSTDGSSFTPYGSLNQTHAYTFHWMEREFTSEDAEEYGAAPTARFLRLYVESFPMELGELFVLARDGYMIDPSAYLLSTDDGMTYTSLSDCPAVDPAAQLDSPTFGSPASLFDEQSLYADEQTYMNSMYFDEIYHGRTAREYLLEDNIYENTHPPLGKSLISLGILLFGMTPLGWRFMGTLFGVLMVPFAYAFIKNLFGKTWLSVCGTLIFAFEFMHFTQTRIATIDTYGLFFTILMYFFMYRFLAAGYDAPARARLVPLALCGVSFGCGIASKWTCFYAAAGLVVLYAIGAVAEGRRLAAENRLGEFLRKFAVVVAVSFLFFVGVAGAIYCFSYLPFAAGTGREMSLATVWQNQETMFNYHSGLSASHGHQSSWWMWLLDVRPVLYVFKSFANGTVSAFSAFNTPIVSWAGLAAVTALAASLYRGASRRTKLTGAAFAALAAAAFAAQIVTYAVTYFAAEAQGLDLVEDVAYTHHPFSYVFAVAAVCAVITPFVAEHARTFRAPTQGRGSPQSGEPAVRADAADSTDAHTCGTANAAHPTAPLGAHGAPAKAGAAHRPRLNIRPLLPAALFILATGVLFAVRLIGYDPESTSLVAATDTPSGYLTAALVCIAVAAAFAVVSFAGQKPRGTTETVGTKTSSGCGAQSAVSPAGEQPFDCCPSSASLNPPPAALGSVPAARSLFLLVGYLAQLLAWIPITRNTFAYHYFPSSFFLILALCALFDRWAALPKPAPAGRRTHPPRSTSNRLILAWRAAPTGQRAAMLFTAASLALFALFYPYLSGAPVPRDHLFTFLRWLPSWPM